MGKVYLILNKAKVLLRKYKISLCCYVKSQGWIWDGLKKNHTTAAQEIQEKPLDIW